MTRFNFIVLLALSGGGVLLGLAGWLSMSWQSVTEVSCSEWHAAPREGEFILKDCHLDLSRWMEWYDEYGSRQANEVGVLVFPASAAPPAPVESSMLVWATSSRDVLRLYEQGPADLSSLEAGQLLSLLDDAPPVEENAWAWDRYVERYADLFFPRRDVVGRITRHGSQHRDVKKLLSADVSPGFFVVSKSPRFGLGGVMMGVGFVSLLVLGWLLWLQRRWSRRHPHRPKTF